MSGEDYAQLGWLVLLLVALGGFAVAEFRGNPGRAGRHALAWVMIFVALIAGVGLYGNLRQTLAPRPVITGSRIEIPAGRDGHFHLSIALNATDVRFVIDTGATGIALTRRDAERIGMDPDGLAYIATARTANGTVKTAPVTIDSVRIGDIHDENVPATVIDGELDVSLLGMSYLRRFARVSFEGDTMVLER